MKISVITASYNYEEYIKEAIESVLNQSFQDWELIVVDDGSKDNSVEIIKSYCERDSRIKLFTHENNINKGLTETIKLGIEKAAGEWIVFLESDDILKPDALKIRMDIAKKYEDVNFIFNDVELFGDEKVSEKFNDSYSKCKKTLNKLKYPCNILKYLEKRNLVPTFSAVMIKKSELVKCDFDCPVKALVDHYLWIQLGMKNKFYYINEKLTLWRMHANSFLNSYERNKIQKLDMKIKINNMLAKHYMFNPVKYLSCKFIVLKSMIKKSCYKGDR